MVFRLTGDDTQIYLTKDKGGRAPDEASLLALARRIAQGDSPDPDDGAGRLAVYDAFNDSDGKGTES